MYVRQHVLCACDAADTRVCVGGGVHILFGYAYAWQYCMIYVPMFIQDHVAVDIMIDHR